MMASVSERRPSCSLPAPIVFGPKGHQLFGLYHPPDPSSSRATGVILCNPLGYEAMCVHRMYRHLAEKLAAAGFHALRFDYHGTGDSSGQVDEPARVRAWLDSIGAAVEELYALAGVASMDLVGVRFGATLAAVAAAERSDVRGLVLWAPCVTGRAYVRELRAFAMLNEQGAQGAERARDGEEVAGYLFEQATVLDLQAIDLLAQPERSVERVRLLARGDLSGGEERLARHFRSSGAEATVCAEQGYSEMMRDPQDSVVPFATLDSIVDWLSEPRQSDPLRPSRGFSVGSALTAWSHPPRRLVREEPRNFGADGRLFGILSELGDAPVSRGKPAILFLNVGANHHVGPNRLYVSLCRDLAALGYLTFRFDTAGLGDSLAPDGALAKGLYARESVDDVRAAVSLLSEIRAVTRVVLVGICSGAHLAFHVTGADPRVAGQILINPPTFAWTGGDAIDSPLKKTFKSTRYYVEALSDRAVWAQALRGALDVRGVAGALGERLLERLLAERSALIARFRGRPERRSEIERAFCAASDRGVSSLLVFSSNDGGLDMIEEHLGRDGHKVRGRRNIRLAIIEGADHTFTPRGAQRDLHATIERFILESFP